MNPAFCIQMLFFLCIYLPWNIYIYERMCPVNLISDIFSLYLTWHVDNKRRSESDFINSKTWLKLGVLKLSFCFIWLWVPTTKITLPPKQWQKTGKEINYNLFVNANNLLYTNFSVSSYKERKKQRIHPICHI